MTLNVQKQLIYLGHKLTVNGTEPDEQKIKSILEMPKPEDKKDVQRLLQLMNQVSPWRWGKSQNQSFERIKELLVSKKCLPYYDVQKPVKIQLDASKSGIGAALLQDNRPTAYASKSLTATQQKYAHNYRYMLAVVFGCQNMHIIIVACQQWYLDVKDFTSTYMERK